MPLNPDTFPDDPVRRLEAIMAALRGPEGCPWDKEQNHRTLRTHLLEETYEVLELLDAPGEINTVEFVEELGDLLLQVVFHAQLGAERDDFDLDEIASRINEKLIHRHPHVFSTTSVSGSGEVLKNWERLKQEEGKDSILDGVPKSFPALLRAYRVLSKAERAGFRWGSRSEAFEKVREEWTEFEEAVLQAGDSDGDSTDAVKSEFGDLVLALATLLLSFDVDPEAALREATHSFEDRFRRMEADLSRDGGSLHEMGPEELLERWENTRPEGGDPQDSSDS